MDITPAKVLETIGEQGDCPFGEFIADSEAVVAVDAVALTLLQDQLQVVLATLSEREADIVRLRFGLADGQPRTLEQIGPRLPDHSGAGPADRVQDDDQAARQPSRCQALRGYLD